MKYPSRRDLIKVAELLNIYVSQDKNGFVQLWETRPHINPDKGIWEVINDSSISKKSIIAPYTNRWNRSLITPKTSSYMEE